MAETQSIPCGPVKVIHGPNDAVFDVAGVAVAALHARLAEVFNIHADIMPFVNGDQVSAEYQLRPEDTLEFCKPSGRKSVGERVWTGEQFCELFQISPDDLRAWVAQGLQVRRCVDGSVRITETAADEFNRDREPEPPPAPDLPDEVSTEEAAAILGTSKDTVLKLRAEGRLAYRNAAPPGSSRPVYRYPRESVVRLRTTYETEEPAPAVPQKQSRRAETGKRRYKYIDYD